MKRLVGLLLFLLSPAGSWAQVAPEATGAVVGHVTYADTQQPARLANVVLQPVVDLHSAVLAKGKPGDDHSEGIFHIQKTGLDGAFTLTNVPQGFYYVIVEQEGYVSPLSLFTREELNHPDEATMHRIARYLTPISVTANHTTQAEVRLVRGATISGKVRFEDGNPVIDADTALFRRDAKDKWERVRTHQLSSHSSSHTDNEGTYRFTGLPTGEYQVRASIELGTVITDHIFARSGATAFADGYYLQIFPGDTFRMKDAKPVKAEEGANVTGDDIDVPISKLYSLSGTVRNSASGAPINAAHLTLLFADDNTELSSTEVDTDDGSFHFNFVPGGTYTLQVTKIADVQRTEVSDCKDCMLPAAYTAKKVLTSYGDTSQPLVLTGDLSAVSVQAGPPAKPQP